MDPTPVELWDRLIAETHLTAVHLEMRDGYGTDPVFDAWQAGKLDLTRPAYPGWYDEVRQHTARGVEFRRVRIVSEPVTPYIRFEYEITAANNVAAGEQVRWLPRRKANDLHLPGNDFWVFDDRTIRFGHFAGDGTYLGDEECDDPAVVQLCSWAFDAAWKRAVPHEEYDCPTV